MVSLDPPDRNRAFAESIGAKLPLLSDPEGRAARAYGVLAPGGTHARRWTFFIGADSRVRRIDKDVKPKSHGADVVRALDELGVPKSEP